MLAVDRFAWDTYGMDGFLAAHERLGSSVEHRRADVHELDPDEIGRFDLVLMLGVLYHLRNPLQALERIRRVTQRLLICETHVLLPFVHERYPLIPFFPGDEQARERAGRAVRHADPCGAAADARIRRIRRRRGGLHPVVPLLEEADRAGHEPPAVGARHRARACVKGEQIP